MKCCLLVWFMVKMDQFGGLAELAALSLRICLIVIGIFTRSDRPLVSSPLSLSVVSANTVVRLSFHVSGILLFGGYMHKIPCTRLSRFVVQRGNMGNLDFSELILREKWRNQQRSNSLDDDTLYEGVTFFLHLIYFQNIFHYNCLTAVTNCTNL